MVHKRFIKRGGKVFGPYYYESYRDEDGNTKKRYVKAPVTPQKNSSNIFLRLFLVLLMVMIISAIFIYYPQNEKSRVLIAGRASFSEEKVAYSMQDFFTGDVSISTKNGEFIPADTQVRISYRDYEENFILSDFVDSSVLEAKEGDFYIENTPLSGRGLGYGMVGKKINYEDVDFELEVYYPAQESSSGDSEITSDSQVDNPVTNEDIQIEQGSDVTTEQPDEVATETQNTDLQIDLQTVNGDVMQNGESNFQDSQTESTNSDSNSQDGETTSTGDSNEDSAPITGGAVSEESHIVSGTISHGNSFEYNLEEGQRARVINVSSNGEEISTSEIELNEGGGKLTLSTDYGTSEEGFGKEFLENEVGLTFKINVDGLEIPIDGVGSLEIALVYDSEEIIVYREGVLLESEGNETNLTHEVPIVQLKEIPIVRIPIGQSVGLELEDYFEGATSYKVNVENIDSQVADQTLTLTPEQDFKGARKATIIASNKDNSLEIPFTILVSSGAINLKKTRQTAVRVDGENVKWTVEVSKENVNDNFNVEIPINAEEVKVTKLDEQNQVIEEENLPNRDKQVSLLTGKVIIDIAPRKKVAPFAKVQSLVTGMIKKFKQNLGLTGNAVSEGDLAVDTTQDVQLDSAKSYVIEYETPAPTKEETVISNFEKKVTISDPYESGYEDVIAFTELEKQIPMSDEFRINLYWEACEEVSSEDLDSITTKQVEDVKDSEIVEEYVIDENGNVEGSVPLQETKTKTTNCQNIEVPFDAYDLDGNGKLDYVEWIVPHLSDQTYQLIIEITNAEHLDSEQALISDIYPEVSQLDDVWSEEIPAGDYVRVKFETPLTSNRDITIYPRTVSGSPRIEIYEDDTLTKVAEFSSINDNQYNKVFLDDLVGEEDVFDLLILDGSVEFDHIIDPVDGVPPNVEFGSATNPAGYQTNSDIYVELDTSDENGDHYSFVDFNDDLVGWWRMENTSGSTIYDESSRSNNATIVGSVVINETGNFGNGSTFDGATTSYISIPSQLVLNRSLTISAWINLRELGEQTIFAKVLGFEVIDDSPGFVFRIDSFGKPELTIVTSGTKDKFDYTYDGAGSVSADQWAHVAAKINSTGQYVYLNGVESKPTPTGAGTYSSSVDALRIGSSTGYSSSSGFNGTIDEILIFNRSLSSVEINSLYNASATQYSHNFTGLSERRYTFTGYAVDLAGNVNSTQRTVEIDTVFPLIDYGTGTETNASTLSRTNIYVNVTVTENNEDTITFRLYNSTGEVNTSSFTDSTREINWTGLSNGNYTFNVTVNDTAGKSNTTDTRFVTINVQTEINFTNPTLHSGDILILNNDLIVNTTFSGNNATVYLFDSSRSLVDSNFSTSSPITTTFADLAPGVYYFNATAYGFEVINSTETRTILVSPDGNAGYVNTSIKISDELGGFTPYSEFGENLDGNDWFGYSIANIGDLNGDGIQDLAVGAIADERITGLEDSIGAVYILFLNSSGGVSSNIKITQNEAGFTPSELDDLDFFGSSVANMGDLDGDGIQDLAVGAFFDEYDAGGDTNWGAVYILFMNTTGQVKNHSKIDQYGINLIASDSYGSAVANIGDLDGDGIYDLAIGASGDEASGTGNEGAIYINFMTTNGLPSSRVKIASGLNGFSPSNLDANDYFGVSISNIGDLDGDGISEIAVGAHNDEPSGTTNEGAIYILYLNSSGGVSSNLKIANGLNGFNTSGLDATDGFGSSITNMGDLDGDGIADLAVGAYNDENSESGEGAVYLLYLNSSGGVKSNVKISDGLQGFNPPSLGSTDYFGSSLANLGDINGDGIADLAVGAYQDENSQSAEGAIYILNLIADTFPPGAPNITYPINGSTYYSAPTELNYTINDSTADQCWYSINGGSNATPVTCGINFTSVPYVNGENNITVYGNDSAGNENSSTITITLDLGAPFISPIVPTPNINQLVSGSFTVYVSVSDSNLDSITYNLYTSEGTLSQSQSYTDGTSYHIFSGLTSGTYIYNVTANDTTGNVNFTSSRNVTSLDSCFDVNTCSESDDCDITVACVLHNGLCTGGTCDFDQFTTNATIYTLYDSNGNGRNLILNASNVSFTAPNTQLIFNGLTGSELSGGSAGGDGGTVNITVPWLLNTTYMNLTGNGGNSTNYADGGTGGTLQLNFHGLIRNFTGGASGATSRPSLIGGKSISGANPTNGTLIYNKDLDTCPRDVDTSNNGQVSASADIGPIFPPDGNYGSLEGDGNYNLKYDINCDSRIDVIDIAMIAFELGTR